MEPRAGDKQHARDRMDAIVAARLKKLVFLQKQMTELANKLDEMCLDPAIKAFAEMRNEHQRISEEYDRELSMLGGSVLSLFEMDS